MLTITLVAFSMWDSSLFMEVDRGEVRVVYDVAHKIKSCRLLTLFLHSVLNWIVDWPENKAID